jgi:hypothetical protein
MGVASPFSTAVSSDFTAVLLSAAPRASCPSCCCPCLRRPYEFAITSSAADGAISHPSCHAVLFCSCPNRGRQCSIACQAFLLVLRLPALHSQWLRSLPTRP